jgi:aminoglycoside 3-N-acetyltransferase
MTDTVWTYEQLCDGLRGQCGVEAGDTLIVHSSQAALGRVDRGVVSTVRALKDVVTGEGTLLLPVFSNPRPDGIFKIKRTPSRVGLVTEAFRRSADVKRSRHPTHSVAAWGRRRDEFLADHDKTSALGPESPFHKAAQAGADILMIGCNMTTLSLIHVAEAMLPVPYLGKVFYSGYNRTLTLIDYDGSEVEFPPFDNPTDSAAFIKVQDEMERRGRITHCKLADADCLRFDAMTVLNCALEMLREDPGVLLCDNAGCEVCKEARGYVN